MKVNQQELQERVYGVTGRNKRIRELYAGQPVTLKEIGELYGITKQRVEQIVQNGRDKCQRRPPASSG